MPMKKLLMILSLAAFGAFGRGEEWVVPQRKAPPAATLTNMPLYLEWKWRTDVSDPETGLSNAALKEGVQRIFRAYEDREPWAVTRARMLDYLVDNVALGFSRFDCFPAIACWNRYDRPLNDVLLARERHVDERFFPKELREEVERGRRAVKWSLYKDFDHSAPDWDTILKLGFPGMKARVEAIGRDTPFDRAERRAADACLRFVGRALAAARASPDADAPLVRKAAESLARLEKGPPRTVFDVMQFTMLYFILSEHLDRFQVRTMGNIDRLWWPYYAADLKAGRTTEGEFREEFRHFLWQFGSIDNYWGHPIYLGGTKRDGTTEYNPLSLVMLDVIDREGLASPKFQLKIADSTPREVWRKALAMLRRHRSLVLMGEKGMAASMKPLGLSAEECRDLLVWGCFEWLPRARGNCTSSTNVILPQPIVEMLSEAKDGAFAAATFEAFKAEYLKRLCANARRICELNVVAERHLAEINPALVLTLATGSALKKGEDAFATGFDFNYTAVSACGFATAVDSLLAVKEFVYDRLELTLDGLGRVLADDWAGHEALRLRMRRSPLKWGCGNAEADALGREVLAAFSSSFVGLPNARGGKFVCYGLQSRGFIRNARLPASPDGRRQGDHLSKNLAPTVGAETAGLTGALRSYAATVDPAFFPCGSVFDVMVNPAAVAGEQGLDVFEALVRYYMDHGGTALNVNVVSAAELRDAQARPEKYENLQVRVAGWNVRWNDIPKKEQDEYIRRAEDIER